jgi:hypothetical protein
LQSLKNLCYSRGLRSRISQKQILKRSSQVRLCAVVVAIEIEKVSNEKFKIFFSSPQNRARLQGFAKRIATN